MLRQEDSALVVIDVQERLLPHIHESDTLVGQIVRLIRGFRICRSPILVTEQYRAGLGPTDPRVAAALTAEETVGQEVLPPLPLVPMEKMTFSCLPHPPFLERLTSIGRRQVVLCGIESHVCVLQTALHLLEAGYEVHLSADAVSSRNPRNVEIALRRMEQEGAKLTSVETAVFEMLHICGTPEFRSWSRVIR
jgi:nicotinamidase-related amidase